MAFYSVCSLIIESDILSKRFLPFILPSDIQPEHVDITVKLVPDSHMNNKMNMTKVTKLSYMNVWKGVDSEGKKHWIFEIHNHMCTISSDDTYSDIEIYSSAHNGLLNEEFISELFGIYIQTILECKLIEHGFTILHSACIEIGDNAYAFTGPSGIGKSTRAANWCKLLDAEWISGDRPAIRVQDGIVYGVPWDGKEGIYRNYHCPLKAILKVNRSKETYIQEMTYKDKIQLLSEQTVVPMWDPVLTAKALRAAKTLIKQVPIYDVFCDITDESALKTYQIVSSII